MAGSVFGGSPVQTIAGAVVGTAVRSLLPQISAMMALGLFVFGIATLPYQQAQRQTQWRHPSNSRVGRRPARQYIGPGDDIVTLTGTLHPEITGGKISLALARAMADSGKSWPLIEGNGVMRGWYVIESLDETGSIFFADGSARKIDFTLTLARVDDDDLSLMGLIDDSLSALL